VLKRRVDSKQLAPAEQLSDAERARRERERIADFHGIVDYKWAPDSHHVLFTLSGACTCSTWMRQRQAAAPAHPRRRSGYRSTTVPGGRYVSFVRDQNLWVIELASGVERQLTRDGAGCRAQRRGRIRRSGGDEPVERLLVGAGRLGDRLQALR